MVCRSSPARIPQSNCMDYAHWQAETHRERSQRNRPTLRESKASAKPARCENPTTEPLLNLYRQCSTHPVRKPRNRHAILVTSMVHSLFTVGTFHNRIVPSLLPLTSVKPSGEKVMELTWLVCPLSVRECSPVRVSHNRIALSPVRAGADPRVPLPLAIVNPSGEKTTE